MANDCRRDFNDSSVRVIVAQKPVWGVGEVAGADERIGVGVGSRAGRG